MSYRLRAQLSQMRAERSSWPWIHDYIFQIGQKAILRLVHREFEQFDSKIQTLPGPNPSSVELFEEKVSTRSFEVKRYLFVATKST